jgi:predicted acyltransferase
MHPTGASLNAEKAQTSSRLVSLDALRGLTVALMILVNTAGDGAVSYPQLRHSVWNGCTLTDIVFPTFLFIVGGSIAMAFSSRLARGVPRSTILVQVARRSSMIAVLGLLLNAIPFFDLHALRYYGVLQRIALCYLLASCVFLFGRTRACALAAPAPLLLYWFLLVHVRVPGLGMPGVDVPLLDPFANLASWFDRVLVPAPHLYRHSIYDPEGLLGTIPALANTLFGTLAVLWLRTARPPLRKTLVLAATGAAAIALGLAWSHTLPLNKRLWTSSYSLYTSGIAMVLLAALYWLIDARRILQRSLTPALVFGTNALAAYILSEVLATVVAAIPVAAHENLQQFLYRLLPAWLGPPPFVSMLYSILYVGVCFLPTFVLYRRRIFIKL